MKPRATHLSRLRTICLALPGTSEKVAWGDPTWRVGDKIFAMQKGNYEGGRPSVWLKVADGGQAMLVDAQPQRFFVPPYVGSKGWVGIYIDRGKIPWPLVADLIEESYQLVAPRRVTAGSSRAPSSRSRAQSARPTKSRAATSKRSSSR